MGNKTGIVVAKRAYTVVDYDALTFNADGNLTNYWWVDLQALAPAGKEVVGGGWSSEDNSQPANPATPIQIRFQYNGPIVKGYEGLTLPVPGPPAGILPATNEAIGWRFQGRLWPNFGAFAGKPARADFLPVTLYVYCIYLK